MHRMNLFIISLALFTNVLLGQNIIDKSFVEFGENYIVMKLTFDYKAIQETEGKFSIRTYLNSMDESRSSEFALPHFTILVPSPTLSKSQIEILKTDFRIYENTIPNSNPTIIATNDSTLVLVNNQATQKVFPSILEKNELAFFRGNPFIKIFLNPVNFDYKNNQLFEVYELLLKITFQEALGKDILSKFYNSKKGNLDFTSRYLNKNILDLTDTTGNWINYNSPYLKIKIVEDDLYKITVTDFENLGIDPSSINPRTFQIFESGDEKKIFVSGEDDEQFNDDDYILIWGNKNYSEKSARIINADSEDYIPYLNRYTDSTYYFLTWNDKKGKRAYQQNNSLVEQDILDWHITFQHFEENPFDVLQFLNNNQVENQMPSWKKNRGWYWLWLDASWAPKRTFSLNLTNLYPDKTAKFYLKLVSGGSNISTNAHQVLLKINNQKIDSLSADRYSRILLKGSINSTSLSSTASLSAHNIANGTSPNYCAIDWYEVEYPSYLTLSKDSLLIRVDSSISKSVYKFNVLNATNSDYQIFQISPNLKKIVNYNISDNILSFVDSVNPGNTYFISSSQRIKTPPSIDQTIFPNLRNNLEQVDYLILTHNKFLASSNKYSEFIEKTYSVTSSIFDVQDIFNEFCFGYPNPIGLKNFLKYKYSYSPAPKPLWLLLIGDANYDYHKNRLIYGGIRVGENYVPAYGFPQSDLWYTIWEESNIEIPQLLTGRLPINSDAELDHYLEKVISENESEYSKWNKSFLFFSGGSTESEISSFKNGNEQVISNYITTLPISGKATHFYKTLNPQSDLGPYDQDYINKHISSGGLFISYLGHSGTATWDNGINSVSQLHNNINKSPLMTDFGCSTNKFAEPDISSFGERFVLSREGQAIGYIGNSSLGFFSTALLSPNLFYEAILKDSILTIGEAHQKLKFKMFELMGNSDIFKIFSYGNCLIGDPLFSLKLPQKPDLSIQENSYQILEQNINAQIDSIGIDFFIDNYGLVLTDSVQIRVTQTLDNITIMDKILTIPFPSFQDTLFINFPTKDLVGLHQVTLFVDYNNRVDEILEENNAAIINFNVTSLEIRDLFISKNSNSKLNELIFLNPSTNIGNNNIIVHHSNNLLFNNNYEYNIIPDSVVSRFSIINHYLTRNFFKYKLSYESAEWSSVFSYYPIVSSRFFINDSISFSDCSLTGLKIKNNYLILSPDSIKIEIYSAGAYFGQNCIISKNGQNKLLNSFFRGLGIVVFNQNTLEVEDSKWFELFNNSTNVQACADFINGIEENKIVAIGIAGDAKNNMSVALKNAIYSLGSVFIDSVQRQAPWALIAVKGDPSFIPIELYKSPTEGTVQIDTSFTLTKKIGSFSTPFIGPINSLKNLKITHEKMVNDTIYYTPIIKNKLGTIDTLSTVILKDSLDINSRLNNIHFTDIKHLIQIHTESVNSNSKIFSFGFDYSLPSELALNYQVVSVEHDTITQGEKNKLKFAIYNLGDTKADSVSVKIELTKPDNSKQILNQFITAIDTSERKRFSFEYEIPQTYGYGNMSFSITVDEEEKITEFFKDNNYYEIPFYVKKDTTVNVNTTEINVKFDGFEIMDGDFVSNQPTILFELNYSNNFPIGDTTAVLFTMDNKRVYSSKMNVDYDTINKTISYVYEPELEDGQHYLKVSGNNTLLNNDFGIDKLFTVSNKLKAVDIYNFPNPANDETDFTFRLTKIPETLDIKVYTIAGRLIKIFELQTYDLKTDINKVHWDLRDEDGDKIANGVYLYKVILRDQDKVEHYTQKLAIVR